MAHEANAILAISSTDRYISNVPGNVNQPFSNTLIAQYNGGKPYSNDFQITAPNALMNGYIDRIVLSQLQIQYNVPTIVPGSNDEMIVLVENSPGSAQFFPFIFRLPYGFYTPSELAAVLDAAINERVYGDAGADEFRVAYSQGGIDFQANVGFTINLTNGCRFYFPTPEELLSQLGFDVDPNGVDNILKNYKLFGINRNNQFTSTQQASFTPPQFLYTPYIDLYSDSLTNYQKLKDTDSSTSRRKGLIARLYLSGVGQPQFTEPSSSIDIGLDQTLGSETGRIFGTVKTNTGTALGSAPYTLTYDLNSPKVIKWSRDTAINSLDFQLRDCYGDLLFSVVPSDIGSTFIETFNTEWQMTLLCIEGD
jgi:hypothetical protein